MQAREWGLLLALSLLWGGSFFFTAIALHELPPVSIVAVRVGLAAVLLRLVLLWRREPLARGWRDRADFLIMGLLNNVIPFTLIVWAQSHIPSGLAAILNGTTPLWAVLAAHLLTRDEKLTPWRVAGCITGFLGVALLLGLDLLWGMGSEFLPQNLLAQAAIVAATLSYSCASIFGRRFTARGVAPLQAAAGQLSASGLMLLPLALLIDQPWQLPMPSLASWAALLALAAASTALAYILYFRILAVAGATNLMLVTFLIPVSAILLGHLVLGETLRPGHFGGMALIACGLTMIDGRLLNRWRLNRWPGRPA